MYNVFCFTLAEARCDLQVSPVGPTLVKAVAGSDVTLDVSFSGASDPTVTWSRNNTTLVIWTLNSTNTPDIAESNKAVLRINQNGSLSFVNVPLNYTGNYKVEMAKSGLTNSVTSFTLKVFGKYLTKYLCHQLNCFWFCGQLKKMVKKKRLLFDNRIEHRF